MVRQAFVNIPVLVQAGRTKVLVLVTKRNQTVQGRCSAGSFQVQGAGSRGCEAASEFKLQKSKSGATSYDIKVLISPPLLSGDKHSN